jgi:hypothetical protein
MLTRANVSHDLLIRFDGTGNGARDGNMCVARNFACGVHLNGVEPWRQCAHHEQDGQWLFLDLNAPNNGALGNGSSCSSLGLYVAIRSRKAGFTLPTVGQIGFLHAVEANTMSFHEFMAKTLDANRAIPPSSPKGLELNSTNVFHSADGHTYQFDLTTGTGAQKYRRMVTAIDGVKPADVGVYPLATGPFLQAYGFGGHLEIRSPGCSEPLVLDFHDAQHPRRWWRGSCHEWA